MAVFLPSLEALCRSLSFPPLFFFFSSSRVREGHAGRTGFPPPSFFVQEGLHPRTKAAHGASPPSSDSKVIRSFFSFLFFFFEAVLSHCRHHLSFPFPNRQNPLHYLFRSIRLSRRCNPGNFDFILLFTQNQLRREHTIFFPSLPPCRAGHGSLTPVNQPPPLLFSLPPGHTANVPLFFSPQTSAMRLPDLAETVLFFFSLFGTRFCP